ncbi:hypothetical protein SpCBS45565_g00822 [Spizellomyces sp. 'palustris']|nr:hypothetical protein SpCBS45565_g00822 [Spizellomyces sp. 'palustris']
MTVAACVQSVLEKGKTVLVNTSNAHKKAEFQRYLAPMEVKSTTIDIREPVSSDPFTIVQYKASQFPADAPVLVDDTSLDIEGVEIGPNVKWLLGELPNIANGTRAAFVCILGIRHDDHIHLYRSSTPGQIVQPPRGKDYGFRAYFQPDGCALTMGEQIFDEFNARYHSVEKFKNNKPTEVRCVVETWEGDFQTD